MDIFSKIAASGTGSIFKAATALAAVMKAPAKAEATAYSGEIVGNRARLAPLLWAREVSKEAAREESDNGFQYLGTVFGGPLIGTRIGVDVGSSAPQRADVSVTSRRPPRPYFT